MKLTLGGGSIEGADDEVDKTMWRVCIIKMEKNEMRD